MSILENLKYRFKNGGILEQLIYVNVGVFVLTFFFNTFGFLMQSETNFLMEWFSLPADLNRLIYKPWTLITYGFLHADFLHILMNLIVLFYFGRLFLDYFTSKNLLSFYLLGTISGGFIFLLSYNYFPALRGSTSSILVGASAGVSAIIVGIATYIPNYQLKLPLVGFVKLWHLAAIFVVLDIIQIPGGNAGGHLAHIGGALFGFLYVSRASNKELNLFSKLASLFKKKSPLKTVHNSKKKTRTKTTSKSDNQQQVDTILEKISKSGYDTLTKEEKEFLFKQGRN